MRRARSRAERRAGLAGTLPLFCTQRWASANCRTQRADMGRRTLERPARGPGAPQPASFFTVVNQGRLIEPKIDSWPEICNLFRDIIA